jgi:GxxExxY protein
MTNSRNFEPVSIRENEIGKVIVNSCYIVHSKLGPGLLERIYETCLEYEIKRAGLKVSRQANIPISYDDMIFDEGLRIDLLVEDLVICEIKAVDQVIPVHSAQLLTYLKLTGKMLGYLVNFNVPIIKHGIKRIVL